MHPDNLLPRFILYFSNIDIFSALIYWGIFTPHRWIFFSVIDTVVCMWDTSIISRIMFVDMFVAAWAHANLDNKDNTFHPWSLQMFEDIRCAYKGSYENIVNVSSPRVQQHNHPRSFNSKPHFDTLLRLHRSSQSFLLFRQYRSCIFARAKWGIPAPI